MLYQSRQTLKRTVALKLRRLWFGRPRQKVFFADFQKVGATSLQYALSQLGYRVGGGFGVRDLTDFD